MSPLLRLLLVFGVGLGAAPRVQAAGPDPSSGVSAVGIAAVPVEGAGERTAVVAERVARAAQEGAARASARVRVLPPREPACRSSRCRAAGGEGAGVAWVVVPRVEVADRDYTVTVEVWRSGAAAPAARERFECQICGLDELAGRVADVVAKLLATAVREAERPGTVALSTAPAGAVAQVDGTAIGRTPIEARLAPGPHVVRVERPGYAAVERRIEVPAGGTVVFDLSLVPVRTRPWQRPAGAAAVSGGLAAFGAGVVLLALDGRPYRRRCSGNDVDADGDCRFSYDTIAGGATLAVLGTAAVTAGVFWLIASHRDADRGHRHAAPKPRPRRPIRAASPAPP